MPELAGCKNRDEFIVRFNPDVQSTICRSASDCFNGNYPTLFDVRKAYGDNSGVIWLIPQLFNLSEFCGCKEKLTDKQLEELARIISNEYSYLKISELMMFFYQFKNGRYGRFYGNVDPLVITTALREFISDRAAYISRTESRRLSERLQLNPENSINHKQYIGLLERAKRGDKEAINKLQKPKND